MPKHRAQKCNDITPLIEQAVALKKDELTGQMGLFSSQTAADTNAESMVPITLSSVPEWDKKELLAKEQEAIGCYLSAHPLMGHEQLINWINAASFETTRQQAENKPQEAHNAVCIGLLKSSKQIITKKGDRMAFLGFEDMHSTAEVVLFPKLFAKIQGQLEEYRCYIIKGIVDSSSVKQCKIKADDLLPLEDFWLSSDNIKRIMLQLPDSVERSLLEELCAMVPQGESSLEFQLRENEKLVSITPEKKILFCKDLGRRLESYGVKIALMI
jgi:DNA polymerase-3 subunit alpha